MSMFELICVGLLNCYKTVLTICRPMYLFDTIFLTVYFEISVLRGVLAISYFWTCVDYSLIVVYSRCYSHALQFFIS